MQQHRPVAEALHGGHVVGDEDHRLAGALRARNTSMHFWPKAASPTASTSSMSMMSASASTITANARRTIMPEE